MNKTVLVTGAGGFIGLNVVKEYANNGWKVYALVHHNIPNVLYGIENVEVVKGDVTDENFMMQFLGKTDVVAHVAGLAKDIGSDEKFKKLNFEPIKYLSKIPREKIVYVSTSDVYGIKDHNNADETTPMIEFPKNPYPRYKIMSENWLRENCTIPYVIIRPAAVWGEGDKTLEARVVDFLETSPFIVNFGKWRGKNRWPLANVKNVAKTIVSVSEFDKFNGQAITIIDPERTSIDEYYKQVASRYFPQKTYKSICLPLWVGKLIGFVSTFLSNTLKLRDPLFDPTFYAVHHVSSNLDFSCDRMLEAIKMLEEKKVDNLVKEKLKF
jgi:nucleoside-diphosphate-sugar epimerase